MAELGRVALGVDGDDPPVAQKLRGSDSVDAQVDTLGLGVATAGRG